MSDEHTKEVMTDDGESCEELEPGRPLSVSKKNYFKEFLLDPSSGNFSMSRLCMGIVVMIFMPVYFVLYCYGVQVPPSIIVSSLASLATVYGLNSFAGSYYGRSRRFGGYGMGMDIDAFSTSRFSGMDLTQPSTQTSGKIVKVGTREIEEIER